MCEMDQLSWPSHADGAALIITECSNICEETPFTKSIILALCLFEQLQPVEGEVSTDTNELHGMGNFRRSMRGRENCFGFFFFFCSSR
jgi:hypothetical protein